MTTDKVTRAADYLESTLKAKRISAASAARMAGLTPAQGRNLFSGRELPTRDQALRIALSMAMRPDEANRLLRLTGNEPLMQDEARDRLLADCLEKGLSIQKASELLADCGERTLV